MAKRSFRKHFSRAVSAGRNAAQGIKGTGMAALGGAGHAGLTYLMQSFLRGQDGTLSVVGQYAPPVVGILAGHFLKRVSPSLGTGLIGAGGYQAGQAALVYFLTPAMKPATTQGIVEPRQVTEAFRAGMAAGSSRVLPPPNPLNAAPSAGAPSANRYAAGSARSLG